ncbi:MAG: type II toxin-antitoxin system VapC family toxin [Bacteroidota bacterium]|nr:type II toxin-antitoxin system VapC family toxin [Bacteroidota bacterium]
MKYLIDTHILIKYMEGSTGLSKKIISIISDEHNEIMVSNASLWEMAIKISIGKLKLSIPFSELEWLFKEHGFKIYDFTFEHLERLIKLPFHHNDPFDRLIIAQGERENIPIMTHDKKFKMYKVKTIN